MYCQSCGTALENNVCPNCGNNPSNRVGLSSFNFSDFINFRQMITTSIIKWVFIVGSAGILLGSLFLLEEGGIRGFLIGLLGGVVAVVGLRMYCEIVIVLFAIHRELKEINANSKQ